LDKVVSPNSAASAGPYTQIFEFLLQFLQSAILSRTGRLIEPAAVGNPDSERGLLLEMYLGIEATEVTSIEQPR